MPFLMSISSIMYLSLVDVCAIAVDDRLGIPYPGDQPRSTSSLMNHLVMSRKSCDRRIRGYLTIDSALGSLACARDRPRSQEHARDFPPANTAFVSCYASPCEATRNCCWGWLCVFLSATNHLQYTSQMCAIRIQYSKRLLRLQITAICCWCSAVWVWSVSGAHSGLHSCIAVFCQAQRALPFSPYSRKPAAHRLDFTSARAVVS